MNLLSEELDHLFEEDKPRNYHEIADNLSSDPFDLPMLLMYDSPQLGLLRNETNTLPFTKHARHWRLVMIHKKPEKQKCIIKFYNLVQYKAAFVSKLINQQLTIKLGLPWIWGETIVSFLLCDKTTTTFAPCTLSMSTLTDKKYNWLGLTNKNGGRGYCITCAYSGENHGLPIHYIDKNVLDYHERSYKHIMWNTCWSGILDFTQDNDSEDDTNVPTQSAEWSDVD